MNTFCRRCKQYIRHDDNFGYCVRYNTQARHDDTCKTIIPTVVRD